VAKAADYAWSSHKHFIGARVDGAITEHPLFLGLASDKEQCQRTFATLSNQPLEPRVVEEIRLSINTDSALGSDKFLDNAETLLGRSVRPPKRGRPAKVCYR
jgi:putative transposase